MRPRRKVTRQDVILYAVSAIAGIVVFWLMATSSAFVAWSDRTFGMDNSIIVMTVISLVVWIGLYMVSVLVMNATKKRDEKR